MTKKKQKRQQNDIRYVCAYYNYVHFSMVPILSNCILSVFHLYLKRLNNVRPVHKVKLVQKKQDILYCFDGRVVSALAALCYNSRFHRS